MRGEHVPLRGQGSVYGRIQEDADTFSQSFDPNAAPVGIDMAGHDTFLLGPKVVILDSFIVDLLHVDTSAQTFRLKLLLNMDWEDDGTIEQEEKAKRTLGGAANAESIRRGSHTSSASSTTSGSSRSFRRKKSSDTYKTGKYVLRSSFMDDPLQSTWDPNMVLVNAISDENPIEAGSKFHSVELIGGRPVVSRSLLYQPECRCEFTFANFPFDETELVVRFSSNKWTSEQVLFEWSGRLKSKQNNSIGGTFKDRRSSSRLKRSVDKSAVGGVGLSEFEILDVRVESDENDMNIMQRYDYAEGSFSRASLIIRVRRDPYSYLMRVAVIAELLMFLEVFSFWADSSDISARFSVSGTNFLAMVSLYGPMADMLPKVSVVTRVDKWHLSNFFLLFASNVENLVVYFVRNIVNSSVLDACENLLALGYLILVTLNLLWFIKPLYDRDEFALVVCWIENKRDVVEDWFYGLWPRVKGFFSFRASAKKKEKRSSSKNTRNSLKKDATLGNRSIKFASDKSS